MKKLGLESVFKTEEQQHQHSLNNEFSGGYHLSPLEIRQPKADREATAEQPVAPKQDVPVAETAPNAENAPKTENTPKPVKAVDLGPTVVIKQRRFPVELRLMAVRIRIRMGRSFN